MSATEAILWIFVPFVLAGGAAAGIAAWRYGGGSPRAAVISGVGGEFRIWSRSTLVLVALWILLTGMSLWCVALACVVGVYLMLFWLGSAAAWVSLGAAVIAIVAVPVAWAWTLFR